MCWGSEKSGKGAWYASLAVKGWVCCRDGVVYGVLTCVSD